LLGGVRKWRGAILDAGLLPLIGPFVVAAYRRYFKSATGRNTRLFDGIFPSFAAAEAAIPAGRSSGYDNCASAERNIDEWRVVYPSDYPVMFWLAKLMPECKLLFDWGGNVGLKYFAYDEYFQYPEPLIWLVADVPAVVDVGRAIARREGTRSLQFTSTLDELPRADVLLAAGSLHFIDDPFGQLHALTKLPPHFILSKVPTHAAASAWTLNNMGTAMCPYHLFNRDELVRTVEDLGYHLIDEWQFADNSCKIPFYPEYKIDAYSGFYFSKNTARLTHPERG
jgi:putative methyltransferase (TIGR04325 family)